MRIFHVSEESGITLFQPRVPDRRPDLDQNQGLVWAISEKCLPNFLTPRECPRVCYYANDQSSELDRHIFFSSPEFLYTVAVEYSWLNRIAATKLYVYEFDITDFTLQDETAGYYVSTKAQKPLGCTLIEDIFQIHYKYQTELRVLPELMSLASRIKNSSLSWSLCKMKNLR